jgi:cytochrome c oxidase cbb3-type subunit 3
MTAIRRWHSAVFILSCAVLAAAPFASAQIPTGRAPAHEARPRPTPERIAAGKQIFDGTCANCHGMDGSGANGPNIRGAARVMGPEGLYNRIYGGLIGSGMPSFASLGQDKIWEVVDYVSTLGEVHGGLVSGNAQKGKEIYAANDCASCHMIDGQGGSSGPDLSKIGAERSGAFLLDELLEPGANRPTGTPGLPDRSAYEGYLMYRVTLPDGKVVEGTRVNEDSFTLQLRNAEGNIVSVNKLTAKNIEELPDKSFMPSYKGKLSEAQLDDLVAYLSSLGGAQ